ncbi:MAG: hypothetical protein AAB893_02180 [Patescibacteria group bacterium]
MITSPKTGQKFYFFNGITEKLIKEVLYYSTNDESVVAFTSDSKRFKDRVAYDEWIKKGKTVYTLVDTQEKLAGLIWFNKKPLQFESINSLDYDTTGAIRTYGTARGAGVSKLFLTEALSIYKKTIEYRTSGKGIWLETSVENLPAIKLYTECDFRRLGLNLKNGKEIYIKDFLQ